MTSNIIGSEWINGSKGWLWRGNSKSIFHGTGTEIAALDPVTPTSRYAFAGNGNDSVGSNNLTANGSPTYGSGGGVYGQYVILNGSSQYFTASANTVFDVTTQDFSLWGFLYRSSDSGALEQIAIKRDNAVVTNKGYAVFIDSSDKLSVFLCDGSASRLSVSSTSTISLNTWYFWAATFDRDGSMTIYLHNMSTGAYETGSTSISTQQLTISNTQTFTVGRRSASSGEYFSGRFDHLNVLIGTAITAQNVQDIISKLHGGQIAQCHGTSGGFTSGLTYKRDMENTTWYQLVDTNNDQTVAGNKSLTGTTTLSDARISTDASIIKHSTTNNAGDLLKNTGTKYDRFARGSAFNFLRVNSGATDIEYDEIFGNELGRSTTITSNAISVASFTAKDKLMVRAKFIATGGGSVIPILTFNSDTGSNYSYRYTANGGAETTGTSATGLTLSGGTSANGIIDITLQIRNISANRKLVWGEIMTDNGSGAGTSPVRVVFGGLWDNTSTQITTITISSTNISSGEIVVFGMD